jgi:DNA-binding LacI/PurR family transcriptional regulator
VAVTGWDNIQDGAYTDPALTTLDAHVDQIAEQTVDLLLKRIATPNGPSKSGSSNTSSSSATQHPDLGTVRQS